MFFLKYIYYSQYFELRSKEKEEKAFLNGNVLVATIFVFLAGALFMIQLRFFEDYDLVVDFIADTFKIGSDRLNGKILGLVALLIAFLIVRFTIGTKTNYNKTIDTFNTYSLEKQTQLAKVGNYLFIGVIFSTVGILLFCLFTMN